MRRLALFAVALLPLAGCSLKTIDPCGGVAGSCIGVQIQGDSSVTRLDHATIHLVGNGLDEMRTTGAGGGAFTLPVAVALLPGTIKSAASIRIDVVGTLGGRVLGGGGTLVSVAPNQHVSATIKLVGGAVEDAGAPMDLSPPAPGDMASSDGGTGISCQPGYHACNDKCVDSSSVDSCGASCAPCPVPAGATGATCDGTTCGITCAGGSHVCNGACVASNSPGSCNMSCTPCNAPTGGTATCDGTQCGGMCNDAQHKLCPGLGCIPVNQVCNGTCPSGQHACNSVCDDNNSVNSCGSSCTPCPVPSNAMMATCNGTSCDIVCAGNYKKCTGAGAPFCIPPTGCCVSADCPNPGAGTVTCNSSNQCVPTCNNGYTVCGALCKPITDPASCGPSCLSCPAPTNGNGSASCDGSKCGIACNQGYVASGNQCVACGGKGQPCCASNACNSPYQCSTGGASANTCIEKTLTWSQLTFKPTSNLGQLWMSNSGTLYLCGSNVNGEAGNVYSLFFSTTPSDPNSWSTPAMPNTVTLPLGCGAVFGSQATGEVWTTSIDSHMFFIRGAMPVTDISLASPPSNVVQMWIDSNLNVYYPIVSDTSLYKGNGEASPTAISLGGAQHGLWGTTAATPDIYVAGDAQIWSSHGGTTFTAQTMPSAHYYAVWVSNKGDVYFAPTGFGIVHGKVGSKTWNNDTLPAGIPATVQVWSIWGSDTSGYVYAVGDGSLVMHSVIGSGTWTVERAYDNAAPALYSVFGNSTGTTVYADGDASTLLRGQ